MRPLLTAEEMRTLDRHTIDEIGLPGAVLMESAGRGVHRWVEQLYADRIGAGGAVAVVCGRGNNGGDGFVVGRCLVGAGRRAVAYLLGRAEEVSGDAALHLGAFVRSGGTVVEVGEERRPQAEAAIARACLVLDALLGTGLTEDVRGIAAEAIAWMNASEAPVVSVDLPSGISSNTGRVCGAAVRAELTVTFGHEKRGHLFYPGAGHVGRLEVVDIGIPRSALGCISPAVYLLEAEDVSGCLGREPDAHKGRFGHVLVFGGSPGREGAACLAASAALRAGAGLATVAWPAGLGPTGAPRLPPEVMWAPLQTASPAPVAWEGGLWAGAAEALGRADALVVGPGMGTGSGAADFLARLLGAEGPPAVLDADALNLLAGDPGLARAARRALVLTPHPGEAARLLETSPGRIQADRLGSLWELVARYGCAVVLKGARTLVAEPGGVALVCPTGNPGMASAGSGDVLSGVLGAFLARGLPAGEAARLACYAHGLAGDLAAGRLGVEGLTASDLVASLPEALQPLSALGPSRRPPPPCIRGTEHS